MKKLVSAALLAGLALFAVGCGEAPHAETTAPPQEAAASVVTVTPVVSRQLQTTVHLPAQLLPYEAVDVYSKVTGFLQWIRVDRGSRVAAGESIARVEAPELQARRAEAESKLQSAAAQLAAAQAKLTADQATYQRMQAASRTPGVVAPNDLEIAQMLARRDGAEVEVLRANVGAAKEAMRAEAQLESYLDIRAPFAGWVTARYVHPGALLGPDAATPIVRIETLARDRVVVPVPEYEATAVPAGALVAFTIPAYPGRVFRAPIARVSRAVDIKTRTMSVELDVRDPRRMFDPGTFCEVEWPVRRSYRTLFVPASAVANDLERSFVIRVRNNRTEWVDVTTGETWGKLIEVFGGLRAGDDVVIEASDQLAPGAKVTPRLVPGRTDTSAQAPGSGPRVAAAVPRLRPRVPKR